MEADKMLTEMREAIDNELRIIIRDSLSGYPAEYVSMLNYQLGWEGLDKSKITQGKRIRPLLVLLACKASGGNWREALPAAASVELVHNFSLIHDDIQDCSELRRGRPTVWVKWGDALAINAGDAMLTLAHLGLFRLSESHDQSIVLQAAEMMQTACLKLTRGQYLDIAFESEDDLPVELYWQMVEGKTGSLLATCLGMGALIGGASAQTVYGLFNVGIKIGNAFQVQDDWLGIWGDDELTGKSSSSDLISKKKTYPVLLGMRKGAAFCAAWKAEGKINLAKARQFADLLVAEGQNSATKDKYEQLYTEAFNELDALPFEVENVRPLIGILQGLFGRIK